MWLTLFLSFYITAIDYFRVLLVLHMPLLVFAQVCYCCLYYYLAKTAIFTFRVLVLLILLLLLSPSLILLIIFQFNIVIFILFYHLHPYFIIIHNILIILTVLTDSHTLDITDLATFFFLKSANIKFHHILLTLTESFLLFHSY